MSRRQSYIFVAEPTGEVYRGLLETATSQCSIALLVTSSQAPLSATCAGILDRLKPHLIASEQVSKWPGTELLSIGSTATLWSYKYSKQVASILLRASSRLYAWTEPELPEDLALLRAHGNVWLGSVGHESDAWLELTDAERDELAQRIPGLNSLLGRPRRSGTEVPTPDD
jgi:hypothetical protein